MSTAIIATAVVVSLIIVYGIIHRWDRRRGRHIALVEERATDGSWQTHELVLHPEGHYRLLGLGWSQDLSSVHRRKIVGTSGTRDKRDALQSIATATGKKLHFASVNVEQLLRSASEQV